jgi:UDP-N-acetyl-D-mannosaminuronic acid dehydrogenase
LECRRVLCTDPYVADPSLTPLPEVLEQADLLIVATPHACYRGLKCRQPVIDVTETVQAEPAAPVAAPGPAAQCEGVP